MQYLLARARRDPDGVRDFVRGLAAERLGTPGRVLVADETGDLKRAPPRPGYRCSTTGTGGRVENAQDAVYLDYASAVGVCSGTPIGHRKRPSGVKTQRDR